MDTFDNFAREHGIVIKESFRYIAVKIYQHNPYFYKYYKDSFKNENQLGIEELFHKAENAIMVSEITNDNEAIGLINKVIKDEYDPIKTPITIKEALNCLKLRDRAFITQGIQEVNDFSFLNHHGTEYEIKLNDNSVNYIKLKNFNLIINIVKWLNLEERDTPHVEKSALESIRIGIGIEVCLKDFKLLNGLDVKINNFIKNGSDKYNIILFQFSNFLFYYLKNIFQHAVKKRVASGFDEGFDHTKFDEATKVKWIGYACRDKYPKDINHSRKRPVPIDNDGIYSITNNYAFKFDKMDIKDIKEKKILLITDASYPFISDFDKFTINVLFYDFKNSFDHFLNDVMDELNRNS
ncbi:21858_t:CDS:1 [Gigaspora margarita]|uniref:21858_t:CDS:1 n=1 Tax=Gigaspora margarita TaxID=4874 RepID=A0ABN7V1P9_GIGMA|nr:21858_t:CDS:1 [Gigaspora margarita]